MEAPDLVGADVATPVKTWASVARRELLEVARVHGEVALVDGDAEPAQDGVHGAAVKERRRYQ